MISEFYYILNTHGEPHQMNYFIISFIENYDKRKIIKNFAPTTYFITRSQKRSQTFLITAINP